MGIQNNLKIRDGSLVSGLRSSPGNFYGSEIRHAIFWGLRFGPRNFGGFVSSPIPPFDHPCYLKSGVPPGHQNGMVEYLRSFHRHHFAWKQGVTRGGVDSETQTSLNQAR